MTDDVTATLRDAGFLIGAKSILAPVAEVTWMGKTVNAQAGQTGGGGGLRSQVDTQGRGAGDTSVPEMPLGPLGLAWAPEQHRGGILEWGTGVAAFWAEVGTQGAAQPC